MELGSVIEKVIIDHGIVLHHSDKMKKYMAPRPKKQRSKIRPKD